MRSPSLLAAAAVLAALATPALAEPQNVGPPHDGRQLVDMADRGTARSSTDLQPIPTTVQLRFVAEGKATRFSFDMRADRTVSFANGTHIHESDLFLDDVFIERVDPTTNVVVTGNLVTNGDFEGGVEPTALPTGWIFDQPEGPFVPASGHVTPPGQTPIFDSPTNHSFVSFADDEYNALSQTIATIPGATYDIGFTVAFRDNNERNPFGVDQTDFIRTATFDTDGRQLPNGLDLVLTATNAGKHDDGHVHFNAQGGDGGGAGVPEPAAWTLMILGFAGVGGTLRRQRGRALA